MHILLSLVFALVLHISPIITKLFLDPSYTLSIQSWSILAGVCLLQVFVINLPGRWGLWLARLGLLFLSISLLLNFVSLSIFASPISLSGLVAVLQSNASESSEFLREYAIQIGLTAAVVSPILVGMLMWSFRRPIIRDWRIAGGMMLASLICFLPLLKKAFMNPKLAAWDIHELVYADRLLTSFIRYHDQMSSWQRERHRWTSRDNMVNQLQLSVRDANRQAPLVVVVIGESTTRHHMGIYGYSRPTTPSLSAMRDDLLVFSDVISPTAHTIPAVMGTLCSKRLPPGSIICPHATLIDLAKGAGYEVTWISNQAQLGFDDNVIVHMGQTADYVHFVNYEASSAGEADHNRSLDEKILKPFHKTLNRMSREGAKQFVFIHLMGTHFTYEKRYPQNQAKFREGHPQNSVTPEQAAIINHYDNAIAYQDMVLGEIFTAVRSAKEKAIGVYFSDHGEEVYRTKNFHGHNDQSLTPAMSEIPFVVAVSESYQRTHKEHIEKLRQYQNRPFTLSRFTPSMIDLLGLSYLGLKGEDSLFSEKFESKPRLTADGLYQSQDEFRTITENPGS